MVQQLVQLQPSGRTQTRVLRVKISAHLDLTVSAWSSRSNVPQRGDVQIAGIDFD